MRVFVKNKDNKSLMPCKPSKARTLLKADKAEIIDYKPFTIRLKHGSSGYTQKTTIGVDTGMKHIGVAITINDRKVIAKGEIELRQDVKSTIETRRIYRRSRRTRKTRYRKPRFQNRTRKKGWLPPSIQSRIDNTIFWIEKFQSLLPKNTLIIELGKFDPHKLINPDVEGINYQMGQLAGYYDVRHFVFERDHYTCQVCKKSKDKILNTHHIVYTSEGGTNRGDNLITVCTDCHTSENHKKGQMLHNWMLQGKRVKQYKAPTFMNIVRKRFYQHFEEMTVTYGSTTKPKRKELNLEKTHYNDAFVIAGGENQKRSKPINAIINRRNNRSLQTNRKTYGRSVRTQKYPLSPGDLVKNEGDICKVKGMFNYGKWVRMKDNEGNTINSNVKDVELLKYRKGLCFVS